MKIATVVITLLIAINFGNGKVLVSFLDPDCGVSISESSQKNARIIQGSVADMFGNPWMALISSGNMCGGSLITNRFVLSAAHCTSYSYTVVYLGEFDRSTITDCSATACMPNAIRIPVDAQIAHPRYVDHTQNDIALFRLATPVQYTAFIKPICLLTNYNPLAHIRYLTALGWGLTENGVTSNVLKMANLTHVHQSYCLATYRHNVDTSHICAGDSNSHTCMGDSGGPLFAKLPIGNTSRVVQLGIVSYGDIECKQWGVYTNVMHHMNWIVHVVRQEGLHTTTQRPITITIPPTQRFYYYIPPVFNWQIFN